MIISIQLAYYICYTKRKKKLDLKCFKKNCFQKSYKDKIRNLYGYNHF